MVLAIHTVYLPREHILFLEEWIVYHIWQGVDRFYLYNNTGSIGDVRSNYRNVNQTGKCKRGYDIGYVTRGIDDKLLH